MSRVSKNNRKKSSRVRLSVASSNVLEPMEKRVMMTGTLIAGWTFENDAIAVNNSPAPSTGSGTAGSIGMNLYPTPNIGVTTDDVLAGKSSDTGTNTVADTTNIWRIRGQAGTSGAANGWSSAAPIGTQGAQFNVSTAGYSGITVSFDWYTTTQGEANLQLQYTDNVTAASPTWINVPLALDGSDAGLVVLTNTTSANTVKGAYVSDNLSLNGSPSGQDWFTGLTATISDPAAANDPNFAVEMVNASTGADDVSTQGSALNNTSGNWRFDNVNVSGTTASPAAPVVQSNPSNVNVSAGSSASFTSAATGYPTPSEQWQVSTDNGSTFSNVSSGVGFFNSSTYTISSTTTAESGNVYRAVFFNGVGGNVNSGTATLTVSAVYAPTVTTNPSSITTNGTNTVSFTSIATGNPAPTEQWQFEPTGGTSYSNVSTGTGFNGSTYTFTASPATSGSYRAVFNNGVGGNVYSNAATLTVYSAATVLTSPVNQLDQVPNPVTFTASGLADTIPTTTWQYEVAGGTSFSNVSSGSASVSAGTSTYNTTTGAASFTFTPVEADNGDQFRVVFSTPLSSNASSAATLTVFGTTIASWSFPTTEVAPTANNPTPDVGTGSLISLGMQNDYNPANPSAGPADDIIKQAGTADPNYSPDVWRVRGGTGVGTGLGAGDTEGWSSFAPQYTQGAEFQVPTTGYTNIQLHFDWYGTVSGPRTGQLQYTTDGTNWVDYTSSLYPTGEVISAADDYYGSTNATTPPTGITMSFVGNTAVENNPNFAVRLVSAYQEDTDPSSPEYLPPIYDGNTLITDSNGNPVYHGQYGVANKSIPAYASQEIQIGGMNDSGYFTLTVPTANGSETTNPIQYTTAYNLSGTTLTYTLATEIQSALNALPGISGTSVTFADGMSSNFIIEFSKAVAGPMTSNIDPTGVAPLTGSYFPGQNEGPSVNVIYAGSLLPYSLLGTGNWRFANILVAGDTGAPSVFAEPSSQTITLTAANPSQPVTFTSNAFSYTPDITVQWQVSTDGGMTFNNVTNGGTAATSGTYITPISGSPDYYTSSYTTTVSSVSETGYEFRAVFTNTDNNQSAASTAATLLVVQPTAPSIASSAEPVSTTVIAGTTATFTATATGLPLSATGSTATWQVNNGSGWTNISTGVVDTYSTLPSGYESETSTLSVATATALTGYTYQVVFNNASGSITSSPATLTVVPVEQIVTQWNFGGNSSSGTQAPGTGVSSTPPYAGGVNTPAPNIDIAPGSLTTIGFIDSNFTPPSVPAADIITTAGSLDSNFNLNTWRIRGGQTPSSPGANGINGWDPNAPEYSQGAEIDVNATNLQDVYLSFQWFSTSQGVRDLQVQYCLNTTAGTETWTNLGNPYIANSNDFYGSGSSSTPPVGIVANLTNIAGVAGDANLGIRLVSAYDPGLPGNQYAAASLNSSTGMLQPINGTSGNWRFGDLQVNAVAIVPAWLSPASSSVNGGPAVWNYFTQTLTLTHGTATIIGDPAASGDSPNLLVSGAGTDLNIDFATGNTVNIGSLNITGGATAAMTSTAHPNILIVAAGGTLNIDSSSTLNLNSNFLDLMQAGPAGLAAVDALLARGYNNGAWTGTGITSSTAAADGSHLTALGAGTGLTASFDGITPSASDVLVRYTYYGDANLNGSVDGSDYSLEDFAALHGLSGATGWVDFNYDGILNGSDYTLLDNAYNNQGPQITPSSQISVRSPSLFAGVPINGVQSINDFLKKDRANLFRPGDDVLDALGVSAS